VTVYRLSARINIVISNNKREQAVIFKLRWRRTESTCDIKNCFMGLHKTVVTFL